MHYERFLPVVDGRERQVFLVDMKEDQGASLFSSIAMKTIQTYIPQGKKVLILGGKKGLASGIMCHDCGYIPTCKHCDIPIAYHRDDAGSTFGICHICKTSYQPHGECPSCHGYNIAMFGTGLQKIEEYILQQFPSCKTLCVDAQQVASLVKIHSISEELTHIQCVIATSLLQVPSVTWKPDVVIVIRADSSLSIPDWKVSEHCYHMLSNVIAGYTCPVIIQAYSVGHHAILSACKQDDAGFWQEENTYRQDFHYPPFSDMALILYKHDIEETMFTRVNKLYQELLFLQKKLGFTGEIYATPPLIYKMYDKYRYNIVLKGDGLRSFLETAFVELKVRDRGFKIDWLPENIA